jgi:hypothetical protein
VRGEAADPRADIFAIGTILYEMVSGRRAFQGNSPMDDRSASLSGERGLSMSPVYSRNAVHGDRAIQER